MPSGTPGVILRGLQEIDANLEYLHFLIGLETEHPLRARFFQVVGDYAGQARTTLEQVTRQFEGSPRQAAQLESVRWHPDVTGRWDRAFGAITVDPGIDPSRPAVLAYCLDQFARITEDISRIAREINLRNMGSEWSAGLFAATPQRGLHDEA